MNSTTVCRMCHLKAGIVNLSRCKLAGPISKTCARNYWRRSVFTELSTAMQAMENRMRDMDKELNKFFNEFNQSSPAKVPRFFSPSDWCRAREIPVMTTGANSRCYRLELDAQGMEPENINISLKERELSITARREEKKPDGSKFVKENSYHYTLPEEVNPDSIRSSLSDGVLTIEAPLPAIQAKEIPIHKTNSLKDNEKKQSN